MSPRIALHFTLPDGETQTVALSTTEPVLIGRSRDSTIKLNFPSVSRKHAQVVFERGVYWVEDLRSSNGTFVNQKQVRKARVGEGDVLKCGDFILHVRPENASNTSDPIQSQQDMGASLSSSPPSYLATSGHQELTQARSIPPERNAWTSTSPTRQPDGSDLGQQSHSPTSHLSPVSKSVPNGSLIAPPMTENLSPHPQTRGGTLSKAYSDDQVDKSKSFKHAPKDTSPREMISSFESAAPSGSTTAALEAEVRRLKLIERELSEEVVHLRESHSQLTREVESAEKRYLELQGELTQQAQSNADLINQYVQQLDHSERERKEQTNQRAAFAEECQSLKRTLEQARRELSAQSQMSASSTVEASPDEVMALIAERDELKRELIRQRELIDSLDSGSTQIHVFSLPQPHREATDPDWARHLARFDHLMSEIKVLREQNRTLRRDLKIHIERSRSSEPERATPPAKVVVPPKKEPTLNQASSVSPVSLTQVTSNLFSMSATEPVSSESSESAQESLDSQSPSMALEPTPLGEPISEFMRRARYEEGQASSSLEAQAESTDDQNLTGQKRAWRGMLSLDRQ